MTSTSVKTVSNKQIQTAADLSPEERARVFSESLADCRGMLLSVIRRAVAGAEAEDLLQTAVTAAWARFPQFRFDSKVSTWLYAFTIRVCMTHIGSNKHVYSDDWASQADGMQLVSGQPPEPELKLIATRLAERVGEALDELPPVVSKIVRLNLIEGLIATEIANKLGLGIFEVERKLAAGRSSVRRALNSEV